ncbi:MAG: RimK family alpha-L-glutamate ligase [Candidatus Woesearchaeota archaeon]|jgi:ribosomal protein S6--L-glutamate ligase|nr:RimK family alpha-L-glutamate ligase [Candidatus Woesearchaeota archaeon]
MGLKFGLISLGSVSSKMLLEEAKNYFDVVDHIDLRKIEIKLDTKTTVLCDGEPLKEYDCLYMKGSYRYSTLLYGLSEVFKDKCFVPLDSNAHIIAHNKFMTQLFFAKNKNLKMPGTYFAAKVSETKQFLKTLNYPMILKFPTGTHGKGVIFTESYQSASSMIDALDIFKQPAIIQDYIDIRSDIRVIVAGDKIIGSMRRIAKDGEIRANAHQGGNAEPYVVTSQIKSMCLESAKMIKAGICAVDIIESDYGPLILEINTSPGLQKITEVTKKNIAGEMAKYLFEETEKLKTGKDKVKTKDMMSDLGVSEIGSRDIETELIIRNNKIVLPEFVYKMSKFMEGEDVTIRISNDKIEILRN